MEQKEPKKETPVSEFEGVEVHTLEPKMELEEGRTLVRSGIPYTTAVSVQKPRDIDRIVDNVVRECEYGAERMYYQWTVNTKYGKKIVEGGSIALARTLARNWGNCVVPIESWESDSHYHFRGAFIDLETGFTIVREFRQRKSQDVGKGYDAERKEDIVFQIGQSKAIRNAVLNAIPEWLISKCIEKAKQSVIDNISKEGIDASREKVVAWFNQKGVSVEQLIAFKKKKLNEWTIEDIAEFRSIAQMIKDGEISIPETFPSLIKEDAPPTAKEILEKNGKNGAGSDEKTPPKKKETPAQETAKAKRTGEYRLRAKLIKGLVHQFAREKDLAVSKMKKGELATIRDLAQKQAKKIKNEDLENKIGEVEEDLGINIDALEDVS